jgi:F1F0 ATPase subunit 2
MPDGLAMGENGKQRGAMNDFHWSLAIAFVAGGALGVFYFGGLWLTVQRLPRSSNPHLLALASFIARIAVLLTGVWFVMDGRWERAAACLAGLLVARTALVVWLRPHRRLAPPRGEADYGRQ